MELKLDTLNCTGCRICEFACNYHYDGTISPIGSSIMFTGRRKRIIMGQW